MRFELTPATMPEGYGDAVLPLAQAKAHLRVLHDEEDDLIAAMRDAAVQMIELYCGVYMRPVTGLVWRGEAYLGRARIGVGPVRAISAVSVGGAAQVVEDYPVLAGDVTAAKGWPSGMVEIIFSAGYDVPPPLLVAAARMMLGHLYAHREAVMVGVVSSEVPLGVRSLCNPFRSAKV